jgi:hypothetical protein
MSIAIEHLISNGERMKTYEVTTTVSFTCTDIVEADGEETAKEQAEGLALRWIAGTPKHSFPLHVDQDAVEITSPNDEAKKYI